MMQTLRWRSSTLFIVVWVLVDFTNAGLERDNDRDCSAYNEWDIRLAGFDVSNAGRVEVCHNRQWGLVCIGNLQDRDAKVICRQLGCSGVGSNIHPISLRFYNLTALYKFPTRPVKAWLNSVSCIGNETRIAECKVNPSQMRDIKKETCKNSSSQVAAVVCGGMCRIDNSIGTQPQTKIKVTSSSFGEVSSLAPLVSQARTRNSAKAALPTKVDPPSTSTKSTTTRDLSQLSLTGIFAALCVQTVVLFIMLLVHIIKTHHKIRDKNCSDNASQHENELYLKRDGLRKAKQSEKRLEQHTQAFDEEDGSSTKLKTSGHKKSSVRVEEAQSVLKKCEGDGKSLCANPAARQTGDQLISVEPGVKESEYMSMTAQETSAYQCLEMRERKKTSPQPCGETEESAGYAATMTAQSSVYETVQKEQ